MYDRGCFGKIQRKASDLKEYAEELISEFCKGYLDVVEQDLAFLRAPLHQRGKRKMNKYALSIWQICVLKKTEKLSFLPKYNKELINESWLRQLVKFSACNDGPKLAKEYLERFGIAFITEPHFEKTFLDGAAIMFKGRPIIALTLRHNRIDNFWFVLAHELAHLMKHINTSNDKIRTYIDDLDEPSQLDPIEVEADSIANEALIPHKIWENSKIYNTRSIEQVIFFAKKNQINPAIVAGRIRRQKNNYRLFSKLVSQEVSI